MSGSIHQDASAAENEFSGNTMPFPGNGELPESENAAPEKSPPGLASSSPSENSTESKSVIWTVPESSSSGDSADPSFLPSEPRRDADFPPHDDDRQRTVDDGSFAASRSTPLTCNISCRDCLSASPTPSSWCGPTYRGKSPRSRRMRPSRHPPSSR